MLKDIKFGIEFDAFDLCSPELKDKLAPMRTKFKDVEDAAVLEKDNMLKAGEVLFVTLYLFQFYKFHVFADLKCEICKIETNTK